jgi:predicted nucleic acid-binding protein
MSGNSLVLDSNIVIYHLNGDRTIESMLEGKNIFLSFITEIEIKSYKNLSKRELIIIDQLLGYSRVVHSNSTISELAIALRKKYKLKTPDALILATAQHLSLPLFTADKRLLVSEEIKIIGYGQAL